MDEEYDVVVLGTGLTECILSGMMAVSGKKVLHMDRNNYYGGECASKNLEEMRKDLGLEEEDMGKLGRSRDWCFDLIPKLLMTNGQLVKLLIHTGVTRYLEFKSIEGSYVYTTGGKIMKVPADEKEALSTGLMGLFEKRRFRSLLKYIQEIDVDDKMKWRHDLEITTMATIYNEFKLGEETKTFTGHALALHQTDSYLSRPAIETMKKIKLYSDSLGRYGKSPYLYPLYGLSELPQGFARLSAVYGGTYMLDKPGTIVYDDDGKVVGVKSGDETAKCKQVICDPSYAVDKCEKVGRVVRMICVLNHPIAQVAQADKEYTCQVIIPQSTVGRNHDIYICCLGASNFVSPKGYYLAIVSTTVETENPEKELAPGLDLLRPILHRYLRVDDIYSPVDLGESQVFISKSYDATTHFETTCDDVLSIYRRITGEDFDFSLVKHGLDDEQQQQQ